MPQSPATPGRGAPGAPPNVLSTIAPSQIGEVLKVSHKKADWMGQQAAVQRDYFRVGKLDHCDLLISVKYSGITMTNPEVNYSLESIVSQNIPHWTGLEIVGSVIFAGRNTGFKRGDPVLVFDPFKRGPINLVHTHFSKAFKLPQVDASFLTCGSPMITSSVIFNDYLHYLPTGGSILINDAGSSTGLALCVEGKDRGHTMYGITYCKEAFKRVCPLVEDCKSLAHKLHRRRVKILDMCPTFYDVVVTAAIVSVDVLEIYSLFADVLLKNKGLLIIVCKEKYVEEAAKLLPQSLFASRGISMKWFIVNSAEHQFDDIITANVTKLAAKPASSVIASKPISHGLSVELAAQAIKDSFDGDCTGYQYIEFK